MANLSNINNKFLVTTGGNVLIGQTSAVGSSLLQVTGNSTFAGNVSTGNLTVTNTTSGWTAYINNNIGSGTQSGLLLDAGSSSADFAIYVRNAAGSSDFFAIKGNGNLGIGTAGPSVKLDVVGSGKFQPGIADGDALVTIAQTNSNAYVHAGIKINAGNTNPFYIYQSGSSNTLRFNYNSLADAGGQLVITDSGKVGIGTTSPIAPLHVLTPAVGGIDLTNISRTANNLVRFTNPEYSTSATMGLLLRVFPDSDARQGAGLLMTGGSDNAASNLSLFVSKDDGTSSNISQSYSALHIAGNTGNVGIGTTSPDSKLDVKGASATPADGNQTLSITNTTGGTQLNIGTAENSYGWIEAREGATLRNLLLNPNGGNVGIGTNSPDTLLHVSNNSSNSQLTIERIGTAPGKYGFYTNTGNLFINNVTGGASTIPMVILNNGNVGIGAGNPSSKLAIDGGFDYPTVRWFSSNNTSRYMQVGMITPTEHSIRAYGSSSELTFWTASSFSMVIDGGGNVGINITSPQDKLHVNGDAIISSTRFGDFAVAGLNTTGVVVASVAASTNGQSAIVEFVASGNNGGYYNVVYSCYNGGGAWFYSKNVVGSGGNIEVAETNGGGSSELTFKFRATSGTASYTPRVMMKGMPYNLVTF